MLKGIFPENYSHQDKAIIDEYKDSFSKKTDKELAEIYFKQQKVGITGVRRQLIYLIALREVLLKRFGESPIEYDGNIIEF